MLSASISGAADRLGRLARRFDIAVVGQPKRDKAMPDEVVDEGVLFESGRPVVFVPFIQRDGIKLDRVMVCWDGGRAVHPRHRRLAAAPEQGQDGRDRHRRLQPAKQGELPGVDLGQHLARHGLKVDVKRITSPDIDVPSTILSYAADCCADMIVMGGYGHSRLREFVLGGVTRACSKSMTVPVLMSH